MPRISPYPPIEGKDYIYRRTPVPHTGRMTGRLEPSYENWRLLKILSSDPEYKPYTRAKKRISIVEWNEKPVTQWRSWKKYRRHQWKEK